MSRWMTPASWATWSARAASSKSARTRAISAQVLGPASSVGLRSRRCVGPRGLALSSDRRTLVPIRSPAFLRRRDLRRERLALDVAHRDPENAAVLAGLVDRADPGMVELRRDLGLAPEPLERRSVDREAGVEDLERDLAVEPRVLGEVDGRLPAAADLRGRCGSGRCDRAESRLRTQALAASAESARSRGRSPHRLPGNARGIQPAAGRRQPRCPRGTPSGRRRGERGDSRCPRTLRDTVSRV